MRDEELVNDFSEFHRVQEISYWLNIPISIVTEEAQQEAVPPSVFWEM